MTTTDMLSEINKLISCLNVNKLKIPNSYQVKSAKKDIIKIYTTQPRIHITEHTAELYLRRMQLLFIV